MSSLKRSPQFSSRLASLLASIAIGAACAQAQHVEREFNGAPGAAQALGAIAQPGAYVDGSIDATTDIDCYAFTLAEDGVLDIKASGRGNNQLGGGTLYLYNSKGLMIAAGVGWSSYFTHIHIEIPKGDYELGLHATVTGDYRIDLGFQKRAIPVLSLRGTTSYALTNQASLFAIDMLAEGFFKLSIDGQGIDTRLYLRSQLMTELFRVDTASTSTQKDAGLNAHLPKGRFYVTVEARSPGNASFSTNFTVQAIPTLACNASVQDAIPGGQEDFFVYRFDVTASSEVEVKVRGGPTAPALADSYLLLLDREFDEILENDDDAQRLGSVVSGTLPAASYYAVSTGFWGKGSFTIAATCGPPVTTVLEAGTSARGSIPKDDGHITYVCDLGTRAAVDFEFLRATTVQHPQIMLVDAATGLTRGWRQAFFAGLPYPMIGADLDKGRTHVIVKSYNGSKGPVEVFARAPKFREPTSLHLRSFGPSGHYAVLVVSTATYPGFAIPGLDGFFQLALGQAIVIGPGLLDARGEIDFGFAFPRNSGGIFQSLILDAATLTGRFTNVLR